MSVRVWTKLCVCVCALCWQYSERLSQRQISEVNPGEGDKTHIVSQDNTPGSVTEKEREGHYGVMSQLALVKVQLYAMLDINRLKCEQL